MEISKVLPSKEQYKHKLVNRIKDFYRPRCKILYGDWSSSKQQKGCTPSSTTGIRKLLSKRLETTSVDKFRTSKVSNLCYGELSR